MIRRSCQGYVSDEYFTTCIIYIFRFVSNFANIIKTIVSCYGTDKISQCFVYVTSFYPVNAFAMC